MKSETVTFIRTMMSFPLLQGTNLCIQGSRSNNRNTVLILENSTAYKSVRIRSFAGPYSVLMPKNKEKKDQNNFEYRHYSRIAQYWLDQV